MDVFFDFVCFIFEFQHHRNINIQSRVFIGQIFIVIIFNESAGIFFVSIDINEVFYKIFIQILNSKKSAAQVNHRTLISIFIYQNKRNYSRLFCNPVVVGSKCGGYVYYSCAILGCNKVTGNYPESISIRFNPRYELLVADAFKFTPLVFSNYFKRNIFIACLVIL